MSDKFSVIIRCKNEERWVGHAIQSVIDHIPNNEIVIVDNNSKDRSLEIAKAVKTRFKGTMSYTDINIINLDEYSPGAALNLGVINSSYENIVILSAHCVIKKFDPKTIKI